MPIEFTGHYGMLNNQLFQMLNLTEEWISSFNHYLTLTIITGVILIHRSGIQRMDYLNETEGIGLNKILNWGRLFNIMSKSGLRN